MSNNGHSVLALHGFTGCGEDFSRFSPLCHTLPIWKCPNLPGHGPNPALDCSPKATVEFVNKQICGPSSYQNRPNILLGYSAGARAAILHATGRGDYWDAIILISANPGIRSEIETQKRQLSDRNLADQIETHGVRDFLDYWQSTPMIISQRDIAPEWLKEMQSNREKHTKIGLAESLRQFGQGSFPQLWQDISKIKSPILLITGEKDTKYTAISEEFEEKQKLHPGSGYVQRHTISSVGHAPHLESPEQTATVIDRFIRKTVK